MSDLRLTAPTLEGEKGYLFASKPESLHEKHKFKLALSLSDLVKEGHLTGKPEETLELYDVTIPTMAEITLVLL